VLIIVGVFIALCLLAAGERLVKLRQRVRQRQQMAYRLSKAAARAEVAERKRKSVVAASGELTSLMPAINQPKATFDGVVRQTHRVWTVRQLGSAGGAVTAPRSTGPQRTATGPRGTGPHSTGPQCIATGPHNTLPHNTLLQWAASGQRPGTGPLRHVTGPQRRPGGTSQARSRCQDQQGRPAASPDPGQPGAGQPDAGHPGPGSPGPGRGDGA
jgi:hypothetical protein